MALKRKRSTVMFSSPASDSSSTTSMTMDSSLSSYYHFSKPVDVLPNKMDWSDSTFAQRDFAPRPYLSSRTRKRHRDNRPEEVQIHASTIARLFNAQRERPNAEPKLSQAADAVPATRPSQKTSLHSFWTIPQALPTVAADPAPTNGPQLLCEDCDRPLQPEDAMDLDEDIQCRNCHRSVCDICAVNASQRMCLGCASH